jgi:hypothetical protein
MRQGSNTGQDRLQVFYQADRNLKLGFHGLFDRPRVTVSKANEDFLERLPFGVTYKF